MLLWVSAGVDKLSSCVFWPVNGQGYDNSYEPQVRQKLSTTILQVVERWLSIDPKPTLTFVRIKFRVVYQQHNQQSEHTVLRTFVFQTFNWNSSFIFYSFFLYAFGGDTGDTDAGTLSLMVSSVRASDNFFSLPIIAIQAFGMNYLIQQTG